MFDKCENNDNKECAFATDVDGTTYCGNHYGPELANNVRNIEECPLKRVKHLPRR